MLTIQNLTKHYKGSDKGVTGLDLEIEAGDIYGFIGHNGAGKTTTIKCITGIQDFDEGEIWIDGLSVKKDAMACKERTAYIPDNPDLYEYMTGIQYLNFISDIFRVSAADRRERIETYADAFEITSSLGDLISSYSHGMKQKLAILSALVHEPKLLILDEPFVGLDPKASLMLKDVMRSLCAAGGAIFFSTHVLEVAEKLCNKVAIIKDGRLVAAGRMEDVVAKGGSLESTFMEVAVNGQADTVNTIMGPVLMLLFAIGIFVAGKEKILELAPVSPELMLRAVPFLMAATSCVMTTTATSVSLEGKQWWITKSIPVSAKDVFDAKILLNLAVIAPFYAASEALVLTALSPGLIEAVWLLVLPVVLMTFACVFGITVNLRFAVFDWENEVTIVKQSASGALGGFGGCLLILLSALPVVLVTRVSAHLMRFAVLAAVLAVTAFLYRRNVRTNLGAVG